MTRPVKVMRQDNHRDEVVDAEDYRELREAAESLYRALQMSRDVNADNYPYMHRLGCHLDREVEEPAPIDVG